MRKGGGGGFAEILILKKEEEEREGIILCVTDTKMSYLGMYVGN